MNPKAAAGIAGAALLLGAVIASVLVLPLGAVIAFVLILTGTTGAGPGPERTTAQPLNTPQAAGETVLTEFGDFNCGHCARFALEAMPLIRGEFVRTGRLRVEYKHFPFLSPTSDTAAEASECAREQGKFDPYHDALYEVTWNNRGAGQALNEEDLARAAAESGVGPERFIECLSSGRHRVTVETDRALGRAAGVRGTPALFLNGRPVTWRDYPDLRAQIAQAIERGPEETR